MKENNRFFVLYAHREHEEYVSSTEIVGVYRSEESALKALKEHADAEYKEWLDGFNYNDDDIERKNSTFRVSLYDKVGGVEYTEFEVVLCDVKE